jgi:hypothetical protein
MDQETFGKVLPVVLVDIRNTIVMLRGSNNMVFQVRVEVEDHKKIFKAQLPE